jgi:hypothetical protein
MEGPFVLGYWPVLDPGGTMCLEPSAEDGFLGPLDCSGYTPFLFENAGILGFSSSGEPACELGTGRCDQQPTALFFSQFRAQPDDRSVVLSWYAPGSTRATDFVVHRGSGAGADLVPLMGEIVPIEGGFQLVDTDVAANEAYAYRLFALGREWSPTAFVSTPNWAPLVTGFARVGPNPFRRATDIVFALKEPAHARLTVYDVQGRLVSALIDDALPFGEHTATWNGRTTRGFAPGGVYFVKLEAGAVTQTRKIVYLAGPR